MKEIPIKQLLDSAESLIMEGSLSLAIPDLHRAIVSLAAKVELQEQKNYWASALNLSARVRDMETWRNAANTPASPSPEHDSSGDEAPRRQEAKAHRPQLTDPYGIPRRNRIDLDTPAETAIRKAIEAVELAGCHELLTDAVNILGQAKDKVSDYIEQKTPDEVKQDRSKGDIAKPTSEIYPKVVARGLVDGWVAEENRLLFIRTGPEWTEAIRLAMAKAEQIQKCRRELVKAFNL